MANQNNYQPSSEKNEDRKYESFQQEENKEIKHPYNRNQGAAGGEAYQPFREPANEWQRVGDSSDQHWWASGTKQQQQFFAGEINHPYRENDWGRNQQGQAGIENFYPQEPASERQKQNFAEGSQFPYEGDYGAENPQAREGLERTGEVKEPAQNSNLNRPGGATEGNLQGAYQSSEITSGSQPQRFSRPAGQDYQHPTGRRQYRQDRTPAWVRNQQMQQAQPPFRNRNQVTNQNQNTMRNNNRDYRNYTDYRDEDRGRDRNRVEGRDYDYARGRADLRDRDYERVSFHHARDFNRGNDRQNRDFERRDDRHMDRRFDRDFDRGGYDRRNEGRYHSTETDVPGRGYESEREMNRHANNLERGGRNYGQSSRANRGELNYGVASSHRATGPYEDFERDIDRYGIREDYQGRSRSYGRADYDRDRDFDNSRGRDRNRSFYYRPGEDAERRRRLSARNQDQGLERSRSGNWGPSDYRRDRGYDSGERY